MIQQLPRLVVEIPEAIGLNAIGDDRKQQMPRQMIGRWSLQHAPPPRVQTFEIETTQMHDLVLNRCFGRDTTIATLLSHRIRPPASRDPQPRTKPCYPGFGRPGLCRFVRKQDSSQASCEQRRPESRAPNAAAIPWPS